MRHSPNSINHSALALEYPGQYGAVKLQIIQKAKEQTMEKTNFNSFLAVCTSLTSGKSTKNHNTLYSEGTRLFAYVPDHDDGISIISWNTGQYENDRSISLDLKDFKIEFKSSNDLAKAIEYSTRTTANNQIFQDITDLERFDHLFDLDVNQFKQGILNSGYAVSSDSDRFGLSFLAYNPTAQHLIGCDGHRLSITPCKSNVDLHKEKDVLPLIAHKMVEILQKIFTKKSFNIEDYRVSVYESVSMYAVQLKPNNGKGLEIVHFVNQRDYPNYIKLIAELKEDSYHPIFFRKDNLANMVNLIEKTYDREAYLTPMELEVADGKVTARSKNGDAPRREFLDCGDARCPDQIVCLDVHYVQDWIKSLAKDTKIVKLFVNPNENIILLGEGWGGAACTSLSSGKSFDLIMRIKNN
jgi:hypothetical protein